MAQGKWTHRDSGIGTSIDSFYEYLLKCHVVLQEAEYLHMFRQARMELPNRPIPFTCKSPRRLNRYRDGFPGSRRRTLLWKSTFSGILGMLR